MVEKIKGLSIKGRCFSLDTKFKFFQNDYDRISIVYGKNGSGRTTISEGVACIAERPTVDGVSANLIDEQDHPISDISNSKIFVFNEKYIDKDVRIDNDGLGTIVLLGGQVALEFEIDNYASLKNAAYA